MCVVMRAAAGVAALGAAAAVILGLRSDRRLAARRAALGDVSSIFDLSVNDADGRAVALEQFRGARAFLVVNVASK